MQETLLIKGMLCQRCISAVTTELEKTGVELNDVKLGEVTFTVNASVSDYEELNRKLKPLGFSILPNKRRKLITEVKAIIAEVYSGDYDFPYEFRLSDLLSKQTQKEYEVISQLFSTEEGITIEKYVISFRIQKVKEFLVYSKLTLADIAFRLGFSSVAHLSNQFKKHTGLNPSHFKEIRSVKPSESGHA